jgi:O-antigen/teichoic acid export membrane protein
VREKILELKNRILSDTLAKGIFIIASGTVIAQVIGVITTPIITRLYSPADFGVLGLFTATLSILALAGGFRYELALPLPKEDKDAANLFVFFLFLLSVTSLIFLIIIFLFGDAIASFFHIDTLKAYLFLLIIGFFGVSLYGALTFWVTRRRDYSRITHTRIYQSSGGSISKILLGLFSVGPVGLIIGYLLSQMLGIGTLVRYMWKNDRAYFNSLSVSRMVMNAKQYIQFPLYSFPAGIINALALQLPVFMLSAIYGLNVMGMYAFAYELLILPSSLISSSMLQVYYAEVSNMMRENSKEIKNLYIATTRKLLFIGIPLIIIPCLLAPFFFPLIFGEQWKDAGMYCLPLAILALANFVVSPTSMLSGYGFNHWTLIWDISRTLLVFFSFYIIQVLSLPIMIALLIYSSVMALMYGVNYLMNIRAISLYLQKGSHEQI